VHKKPFIKAREDLNDIMKKSIKEKVTSDISSGQQQNAP